MKGLPFDEEIAESELSLPIQRVISEQSRLVTLARRAVALDAVEELLVDPLSLGPGDDPVPFLVNSYVRAQLLLGIGSDVGVVDIAAHRSSRSHPERRVGLTQSGGCWRVSSHVGYR